MIGPWNISPFFMGLLEDNYIYEKEERKQDTLSQEILQDKKSGKTKKKSKITRTDDKEFS